MTKKLIVLMIHGMGAITEKEHKGRMDEFEKKVVRLIGSAANEKIHYGAIYYQDVFQDQQNKVFAAMSPLIDSKKLRKFMLYSFSDAAGYERNAHIVDSEYEQVQKKISDAIDTACEAVGRDDLPIILIAHSLGGHVLSNYIWDAQQSGHVDSGIWRNGDDNHGSPSPERKAARRLKTLNTFYTTGCNIPIFIAGKRNIKAIKPDADGYDFKWHNYYDEDDVLGWPLKPLGKFYQSGSSVEASYDDAVIDHSINANGDFLGYLYRSWNPLSHGGYWQDSEFTKPVAKHIETLL